MSKKTITSADQEFLEDIFFHGDYLAGQTQTNEECDGIRIWDDLYKEQVEKLYDLVLAGMIANNNKENQ